MARTPQNADQMAALEAIDHAIDGLSEVTARAAKEIAAMLRDIAGSVDADELRSAYATVLSAVEALERGRDLIGRAIDHLQWSEGEAGVRCNGMRRKLRKAIGQAMISRSVELKKIEDAADQAGVPLRDAQDGCPTLVRPLAVRLTVGVA
jgi:hypothetical protein